MLLWRLCFSSIFFLWILLHWLHFQSPNRGPKRPRSLQTVTRSRERIRVHISFLFIAQTKSQELGLSVSDMIDFGSRTTPKSISLTSWRSAWMIRCGPYSPGIRECKEWRGYEVSSTVIIKTKNRRVDFQVEIGKEVGQTTLYGQKTKINQDTWLCQFLPLSACSVTSLLYTGPHYREKVIRLCLSLISLCSVILSFTWQLFANVVNVSVSIFVSLVCL